MRVTWCVGVVALGCAAAWACAPADTTEHSELSGIHDEDPSERRGASPHEEGEGEENTGTVTSGLSASDPVSAAVTQSCTTTSVKGLALQVAEEVDCLRPNTLARMDKVPGLSLGAAVFPYMQAPAVAAMSAAQKARGATMSINSAYRTLPQQYLLYRWYRTGRCGISLAAPPGGSNHESGVAIDINDSAGWRSALQNKQFRWQGASDPVHYDFVGGGTVDIRPLSVKAFQRLWNRNHPEDPISEDGAYGGQTEQRLAKSPSGGFAKGAKCDADAGADAGEAPPLEEVPPTPESPEEPEPPAAAPEPPSSGARVPASEASGCATAARGSSGGLGFAGFGGAGVVAIGAALALVARRQRRRTRS